MSARYYSGLLGRFTSADGSAFIDPANPQSMNLYTYAFVNPLRWVDLTGRAAECPPGTPEGVFCSGVTETAEEDIGLSQFLFNSLRRPITQISHTPSLRATPSLTWKQTMNCAADFGTKYSIAAGVSAITGISSTNFVLNAVLGNDASTVSNFATGRSRLGSLLSGLISNPSSLNLASFAARGVGVIPIGPADIANLGVNGAGTDFVKSWSRPTIAGTIIGKTAGASLSAFTKIKAAYDFPLYGVGIALCW